MADRLANGAVCMVLANDRPLSRASAPREREYDTLPPFYFMFIHGFDLVFRATVERCNGPTETRMIQTTAAAPGSCGRGRGGHIAAWVARQRAAAAAAAPRAT